MSSGRDVMMDNWNSKTYDSPKSGDSVNEMVYYARVNDRGLTHGVMKQVDDNIKIVYNVKEHRIVSISII